jgi:predicted  nucleic acid-binding Zn-ribbon protein
MMTGDELQMEFTRRRESDRLLREVLEAKLETVLAEIRALREKCDLCTQKWNTELSEAFERLRAVEHHQARHLGHLNGRAMSNAGLYAVLTIIVLASHSLILLVQHFWK